MARIDVIVGSVTRDRQGIKVARRLTALGVKGAGPEVDAENALDERNMFSPNNEVI